MLEGFRMFLSSKFNNWQGNYVHSWCYWELSFTCLCSSRLYSNMTTERTKWWKALLPKKKPGTAKDAPSTRIYEPDFDPFAQLPKDQATANSKGTSDESSRSQQESNSSPNSFGDDTYDDSLLESVFNEQTCRRTMKVSRSGRFKEKRRVRSSLPIQDKDAENMSSGKEEIRWCQEEQEGVLRLL